jgi:subtilase family serine protease
VEASAARAISVKSGSIGRDLPLARSAAQQADLDQLLLAQQNPRSPRFHQWLTPEQFADRFGASRTDVAQIQRWLQAQGFTLDYTARSRTYLSFSGTAHQVQIAFHTEIHRYRVGGQMHYSNASDPSIPEAFAGLVAGMRGLDDFYPQPLVRGGAAATQRQPRFAQSRSWRFRHHLRCDATLQAEHRRRRTNHRDRGPGPHFHQRHYRVPH